MSDTKQWAIAISDGPPPELPLALIASVVALAGAIGFYIWRKKR